MVCFLYASIGKQKALIVMVRSLYTPFGPVPILISSTGIRCGRSKETLTGDILRRGTRDIANLRRAKEILFHHIFKDILAAEILVCLYETIIYSNKLKYYRL